MRKVFLPSLQCQFLLSLVAPAREKKGVGGLIRDWEKGGEGERRRGVDERKRTPTPELRSRSNK